MGRAEVLLVLYFYLLAGLVCSFLPAVLFSFGAVVVPCLCERVGLVEFGCALLAGVAGWRCWLAVIAYLLVGWFAIYTQELVQN